jgi:hypothetical protein
VLSTVLNAPDLLALFALSMLKGSLVAMPRAGALARLSRLRSPAWAAVLPGSLVIGTFGPLWRPSFASALVLLAAIATPLLAMVAAIAVARGGRVLPLAAALAVGFAAMLGRGPVGELSSTLLTAVGCLALGVALTRLIPGRWLLAGVVLMCAMDVLLLGVGLGQPAAGLMADASARFHGPAFDSATVGTITIDFPDLVLAGVLGGFVAEHPVRRRAAVTLALLVAAFGMLIPVVHMLPATVPIALTFVFVAIGDGAPLRWPCAAQPVTPQPVTPQPRFGEVAWEAIGGKDW